MCWTGLMDGKELGPFWVDCSMNGMENNEMLKDLVWPAVRATATRNQTGHLSNNH